MSNVVQFLEALARNPQALSHDEFVAVVMQADLNPAIQAALLGRDVVALRRMMQVTDAMCCLVFPADNEEPKEGEERPQEDGDEVPQQDPSAKAA